MIGTLGALNFMGPGTTYPASSGNRLLQQKAAEGKKLYVMETYE